MKIDSLTLGQMKEIGNFLGNNKKTCNVSDYPIGNNVIVRTVTMRYTGLLDQVTDTDFILKDCSWIPDTDRYMSFVAEGKVKECEPYPDGLPVYVNRSALLDMCELRSSLPRSQK